MYLASLRNRTDRLTSLAHLVPPGSCFTNRRDTAERLVDFAASLTLGDPGMPPGRHPGEHPLQHRLRELVVGGECP
jgi:hypothetical protein